MNITEHQLLMAITDVELKIGRSIWMASRYESPHKLYLRFDVKDKWIQPEYIIGPLSRKELLHYLKTVILFLDLAEKHTPNIIEDIAEIIHQKRKEIP